MGRFLNADTLASTGQGVLGYNMFAYCNNNPISFSDETGKMASILVPLATSALMTGVAGAISTFLAGGSAEEILLAGVLGGVFGAMAFGISFLGNLSAGAALLLRGVATFTNSLSLTYLVNGEVTSTDALLASMDAAGDMMFSCIGYYWNGEWIDSSTLENCANAVYDATCDVAQTGLFFSEYAAHPASTTSYTSSSHSGTVRRGSHGSLVVNVLYVY